MSRVAYIRAWPRDPATGSAGLVAMAAGGSHLPYFLDGLHYRAGGVREPRFAAALGFDEKGWTGAAVPTVSVVEFGPGDPALLRAYATLYWKDAAIEVDAGEEYVGVGRILTGTIADAAVKDGKLIITVADFGVKLAKPAVQAWFKGTGGIEGDAVCEGRVKRRSYGYCANVEGRVLLAAYNIYEFGDPARGFQSFPVVRDMGREGPTAVLAWQGSIDATLDALKAAAVQEGGAVVAPSIACVKWWTQPAGPLTADIQGENTGGYVETAAQIAARLLSAANGPAIVNLAAAAALRPAVCGLHIGDDSETTAAALDRLLLPVSLMWRFGTTGQIDIREWSWGGDAEAIQGRFIERVKTLPPTVTRRLGYNRNHRQHNEGEIAADILAAGAAYADGTSIDQLRPAEAGANITEARTSAAFAGQGSLATRNDVIFGSHITSLPAAIDPSNLINGQYVSAGFGRYLDGVTLQALRPGEGGANVTESRVAAAIAGQGSFATLSSLGFGSPLLTGFGALAGLGNLFFGSPYLLEGAGGAQATLAAFKTALGIASGFSGQGALATLSSLGFGSPLLTGFGSLAGLGNLFFGSPYLLEGAGGAQATLTAFKTSLGVAGGFVGQSPWATLNAPLTLVTAENPNLVYDGGLSLQGSKWTLGAGWSWRPGGNGEGPYFVREVDGVSVSYSDFFPWVGAMAGYAQAEMFAGGMTAGAFRFDIEYFDGASLLSRSAQVGPANGQGWVEVGTPFSSPAETKRGRFRFFHSAGTTNTNSAIKRIKVSTATARTRFTDEATYGARYDNGVVMEALKPGEYGANVTEGRVSSGFAGQGALATLSSLGFGSPLLTGFGSLAGRSNVSLGFEKGLLNEGNTAWLTDSTVITQFGTAAAISGQTAWATFGTTTNVVSRLQSDGYMESANIYSAQGSGGFLAQRWPQEGGANVTEGRTSAAFAGQGALATRNNIGWTDALFTGRPSNLAALNGNEQINNARLFGSGVNRVSFSRMEAGVTGWAVMYAVGLVTTGSLGAADVNGRRYVKQAFTSSGAGQLISLGNGVRRFPVSANERLSVQIGIEGQGPVAQQYAVVRFRNSAGAIIAPEAVTNSLAGPQVFGAALKTFATVPNGATNAEIELYLETSGAGAGSILITEPMVAGATQDQAVFPAFNPGPNAYDAADVTSGNTAAAFAGQGALATRNSLGWSDSLFTGKPGWTNGTMGGTLDGKLDSAQIGYGGDTSLLSNRWPQEGGANVTEGRTSAAFAGQGALATRNSADMADGSITNRYAEYMVYGYNGIAVSDLRPEEAGGNRTEGRTSAAFAGQGALATRNSADMADGSITNRYAEYMVYGYNGIAVSDLRPEEAGGNRTEGRTSAAIAGQGAFATKSQIGMWETNSFLQYGAIRMDYSITRSDGTTTVTEAMAITQYGISAGFSGQGFLATRNDVDTDQVAQNAITTITYAAGSANWAAGGGWIDVISISRTISSSAFAVEISTAGIVTLSPSPSNNYSMYRVIDVDTGVEVVPAQRASSNGGTPGGFSTFRILTGISGPKTWRLQVFAQSSRNAGNDPHNAQGCVLSAKEFKR